MKSFAYPSPLEIPDEVELNPRIIEINGMMFQARSDCAYERNYYRFLEGALAAKAEQRADKERIKKIRTGEELDMELHWYRQACMDDLWFFVYFVMKNPLANHPFIVQSCRDIQNGKGDSLQVWARDHLKTTIISIGDSCRAILNNPQETVGIFSATRTLALKIQNVIRNLFESPFLVDCFPDILYRDPYKEAEKWSEAVEGGLIVKRGGFLKEPTVSSFGLTEGMPVGSHFSRRVYDDIVTQDMQTPDVMQKVKENFDVSQNLGTRDGTATVIGTFYNHDDPLVYIMNQKDEVSGEYLYPMTKKTATVDGSFNGKAVFLPEKKLAKLRVNIYIFNCQQLLNPTAVGTERLNYNYIIKVTKEILPKNLYKFMLVDSAGDKAERVSGSRANDSWAMGVIGVEPHIDKVFGEPDIYILDLIIRPMTLAEAQEQATQMYCRNGRIIKLCVEKTGISTAEIHIASALRAKGKYISIENGNLHILRPAGRNKQFRIEAAWSLPLKNSKIHMLDTVPIAEQERLRMEMEKFPRWHDDGLDMGSYIYDVIKEYKFGVLETQQKEDAWQKAERRHREMNKVDGWISV